MAIENYCLLRLSKCIYDIYENIKSPQAIIQEWNIEESTIFEAKELLKNDEILLGGYPICRIRKIKTLFKWEFICDPPIDNNYNPLWDEASEKIIEIIDSEEDLCSLLLIFAIENGDPTQFIKNEES